MLAHDIALALDPCLLMQEAGLEPDPWQESFLRSNSDRQLLLCTRQAGKSTVTAILALHEALYTDNALVLLLSPSLRQSQELFRKLLHAYGAVVNKPPSLQESSLRLELPNGSRIVSLPGKEETVRGFSGVTLLVIRRRDEQLSKAHLFFSPAGVHRRGRQLGRRGGARRSPAGSHESRMTPTTPYRSSVRGAIKPACSAILMHPRSR
jgi:hypothetical protein